MYNNIISVPFEDELNRPIRTEVRDHLIYFVFYYYHYTQTFTKMKVFMHKVKYIMFSTSVKIVWKLQSETIESYNQKPSKQLPVESYTTKPKWLLRPEATTALRAITIYDYW